VAGLDQLFRDRSTDARRRTRDNGNHIFTLFFVVKFGAFCIDSHAYQGAHTWP
jgi:hypothetical protein